MKLLLFFFTFKRVKQVISDYMIKKKRNRKVRYINKYSVSVDDRWCEPNLKLVLFCMFWPWRGRWESKL